MLFPAPSGNAPASSTAEVAIESTATEKEASTGSALGQNEATGDMSAKAETPAAPAEEQTPAASAEEENKVPAEYKSALKKAESYSGFMHMSKAAVYEQLTSEYGEQFTQEEADYAIANLE